MPVENSISAIIKEKKYADNRYGPFRSTHEGLGVLCEEFDELKEAIRANEPDRVRAEAAQVAAVAWRIIESMNESDTLERSGCG